PFEHASDSRGIVGDQNSKLFLGNAKRTRARIEIEIDRSFANHRFLHANTALGQQSLSLGQKFARADLLELEAASGRKTLDQKFQLGGELDTVALLDVDRLVLSPLLIQCRDEDASLHPHVLAFSRYSLDR